MGLVCAKIAREKRDWEYFDRSGWRDASQDALTVVSPPLFSQINAPIFRTLTENVELECLRLLLRPNDVLFPRIDERLAQQYHATRRRAITDDEFWQFFAIWVFDQVKGGLASSHVPLAPVEAKRAQLLVVLTKNRFEAIRAAITMDEATFRDCAEDSSEYIQRIIIVGKLLAMTRPSSAAKQAGQLTQDTSSTSQASPTRKVILLIWPVPSYWSPRVCWFWM